MSTAYSGFELHEGPLPAGTFRRIPGHNTCVTKDGKTRDYRSPEYSNWTHMIRRCYDSNDKRYNYYGGIGKRVFKDFVGPDGFLIWLEWMGTRPFPNASVNRVNNVPHYLPGEMEWATPREQALDRPNLQRNNRTGYRGVFLRNNRYEAGIRVNKFTIYLGSFKCPHAAARAYNEAALKYNGTLAQLNIIKEYPQ